MGVNIDLAGSDHIHSNAFGPVPKALVDEVDWEQLNAIKTQLVEARADRDTEKNHVLELSDRFRANVGAFFLQLRRRMESDLEDARRVSGSVWRCMTMSLVLRRLKPLKYYRLCGARSRGYGELVTFLANLAHPDDFTVRWKLESWRGFAAAIWRTKRQLMEMETEYRNLAVAIVQIGVGVGGMLIGFLGLLLAVASLCLGG